MNWRTPARVVLIPVVSILLVFLVWDLIIRIFNVEPFVAPSPGEALGALRDNWSTLWPLAIETIRETTYGFVLGAVLGFVLAVAMAQTRIVQGLVYPVLISSQAVPIIAIAAPLVILLGFGIWPKIVIVAWIVFFPVAVSVLDGLANVDEDLLKLAHVMGGTRSRVFLKIRLPATVSPLYSGLKIGATYAVTGAIIGELVASTGDSLAGFQRNANSSLDTPAVWGTTILMTAIGIGWFLLVMTFERLTTPWRTRNTVRRLPFSRRTD
ncbi:MAG: ABC transporter permease [Thermoleophilia bacterium]